jgi:DNA polymerase-3 subunit beta
MKIAIDKHILLEALNTAIKSVSTKSTIQILEGFLLEAEGKTLQVTGNNTETAIRYITECEVLQPGKTVIDAKVFLNIITKLPDNEEIDITVSDREMTIESERTVMNIPVMQHEGFPVLQIIKAAENSIKLEQQVLKDMITKVAFAASTDQNRPIMTGILVDINNGNLFMVAVNSASFAIRNASVDTGNIKVVIPAVIMMDIAKVMKSGEVDIHIADNQVMFDAGKFVLTARILDGEFVNYHKFIELEHCTKAVVKVKAIAAAIERIMVIDASGLRLPVIFKIKKDRFFINYKSAAGVVNDEIVTTISGEDVMSGYNPRILLEIFRNIEDEEIQMLFSSSKMAMCKIAPLKGDKFCYLCGPVNFKEG